MRHVSLRPAAAFALVLSVSGAVSVAAQTTGSIRGTVTSSESKQGVPAAQVTLVGTRLGALAGTDGGYAVNGVPVGTYTLRVARIGFEPQTRAITVSAGAAVTADFVLSHTVTRLQEVVTTAIGEFERKAVPNVVANMAVDSIRKLSSATEIPTMIQARVPGLYVQTAAGVTGTGPAIRIRGINSLTLSNEPLLIVDGVRVDAGASPGSMGSYGESKFSDFMGSDIESIDVIKGPSAAALYGTAAGAGVIVVKTKRGQQGRVSWQSWGEEGIVNQHAKYGANYYAWARTATAAKPVQCTIQNSALGVCTIDSVTSFDPMNDPSTTPYHDSNRWRAGVQATGGTGAMSYYVMAEGYNETGPYKMPDGEITRLSTLRGTKPSDEEIHPNALRQENLRANANFALSDHANLAFSSGYLDRSNRLPFGDGPGYFAGLTLQMVTAPGYKTAFNGNANQNTGDIFGVVDQESEQRFTASSALTWQPISWLNTRATVGMDQANKYGSFLQLNGQGPNGGWGNEIGQNGGKQINRSAYTKYSTDLIANATWQARSNLSLKSSLGAQWFRDQFYQTSGSAFDLPVGASQLTAGARQTSGESTNENATYGVYVQEDATWRDNVFFKAGARTDKNSAFGYKQGTVIYPNFGASWVISDESFFPKIAAVSSLRLRTSYGRAGIQPSATAALPFYRASTGPSNNATVSYIVLSSLGNSTLKPEVTTEMEYGTDLGLFNRANVELTYFHKKSHDAIINQPIPFAAGAGSIISANIGSVLNSGWELSVDADLFRTKPLDWHVTVTGANIHNKIVSMGGVPITYSQGQINVPSYPVYGIWSYPIKSFSDADGNGIITAKEMVVGDSEVFRGPAVPPRDLSLNNTFKLFGRIGVSTLMDYHGGGFTQWNMERDRCSGTLNCAAVNVLGTSLERQAAAVAVATGSLHNTQWGYEVSNDYIRFRELSVSYDVPDFIASKMRAHSAQIVVSGRNLGVIWTKYPGLDPEVTYLGSGSITGSYDWFSPPAVRYLIARLNLGL